jgi:hypothetical protein
LPRASSRRGDTERRPLRESTEVALGSSIRLTHAQRVDRVNAYLRRVARNGTWSAIE